MELEPLDIPEIMAEAVNRAYSAIFENRRPYSPRFPRIPASSRKWKQEIHEEKWSEDKIKEWLLDRHGIPVETSSKFFETFRYGGDYRMESIISSALSVTSFSNLTALANAIKDWL